MSDKLVRLSKLMSERGLCSRREADKLIQQALVLVDGEKISTLGTKVSPLSDIKIVDSTQLNRMTILLYKPIGYVSGPKEDNYPSALDLIQKNKWIKNNLQEEFNPKIKTGMAPAGRLDVDSTGLLVLTSDGRVAKKIIGEHTNIKKEYRVKVSGSINDEGLKLLRHGLKLDGEALKPAEVTWVIANEVLKITLNQGKKRQIRRMCELVGLQVTALKRTQVHPLQLKGLKPSEWRFLTAKELEQLLNF